MMWKKHHCIIYELIVALSPFPAHATSQCEMATTPNGAAACELHASPRGAQFEPLKPSIGQLHGSVNEKSTLTLSVLVNDVMKALISGGEGSRSLALEIFSTMVSFLEDAIADYDDPLPAVAKALSLTRALKSLLDASDLDPCEDDVLALKLGNANDQEKNIQTVAIMVNESQYYNHLLKDFLRALTSSRETMPLITKSVERLSRMDTRFSGFTKELLAVLKNIGGVPPSSAPGGLLRPREEMPRAVGVPWQRLEERWIP